MIRCLHCGAETSNGLALCELCQRKAMLDLEFIPVYYRNLARWRPGRAGSRPVPGSRVLYEGPQRDPDESGDRISDRLDQAGNMLTTWARALIDDRHLTLTRPLTFTDAALAGDLDEDKTTQTIGLCAAFEHHLTSISTLDWCGQFVRDLSRHEAVLRGLTETSMPGWYAGACRCGTPTYVVPGLTWVTCGGCGATTYARDHLNTILTEAGEWLARPKALAEAIVALVDTEQSVPKLYARIRKWAEQGDITPIRRFHRDYVWSDEQSCLIVATQETGPARYWFGEVFDRLCAGDTTRRNVARAS